MSHDQGAVAGELPATSLVVGVGVTSNATPSEVDGLVAAALAEAARPPSQVATVATIESRRDHPAVLALGWPVVAFSAAQLASVATPNPSNAVGAAVGTPSVAEASALLAAGFLTPSLPNAAGASAGASGAPPDAGAGAGAELIVTKRGSAHATVAIAHPTIGRPTARPQIPSNRPTQQEQP